MLSVQYKAQGLVPSFVSSHCQSVGGCHSNLHACGDTAESGALRGRNGRQGEVPPPRERMTSFGRWIWRMLNVEEAFVVPSMGFQAVSRSLSSRSSKFVTASVSHGVFGNQQYGLAKAEKSLHYPAPCISPQSLCVSFPIFYDRVLPMSD